MSLLQRLFAPLLPAGPDPREKLRSLWQAVVDEARRQPWYVAGGVADTVTGRFDMITAVLSVVLLRMEASDALRAPSVHLTELFVHDMDGQLREFGVGDVVVGKRVGKLMGAMGGRLAAYRSGLDGDDAGLADAVARNVTFRGRGDAAIVASGLREWAQRLSRTSDESLLAGRVAS